MNNVGKKVFRILWLTLRRFFKIRKPITEHRYGDYY